MSLHACILTPLFGSINICRYIFFLFWVYIHICHTQLHIISHHTQHLPFPPSPLPPNHLPSIPIMHFSPTAEKPPPSTPPESPTSAPSLHPTPPFDPAAEARLLRKLDLRVLPVLWLLFLVCFIDRSNIGNAKIAGMEKELGLRGQRYNVAVFVFNVGYLGELRFVFFSKKKKGDGK